jgi:hypothetical protein
MELRTAPQAPAFGLDLHGLTPFLISHPRTRWPEAHTKRLARFRQFPREPALQALAVIGRYPARRRKDVTLA